MRIEEKTRPIYGYVALLNSHCDQFMDFQNPARPKPIIKESKESTTVFENTYFSFFKISKNMTLRFYRAMLAQSAVMRQ